MAQAKYTLVVPHHDPAGSPVGDVAGAVHHWIHYGPGPNVHAAFIHRNVEGVTPHDHVVAIGEDMPEMDSHMKQLAHHVAQHSGHPAVSLLKEGKGGVQSWEIAQRR